jgi:hypothetical protein
VKSPEDTGSHWTSRPLTEGETAIAEEIFGNTIECDCIRVFRRKFVFFQPPTVTMAPDGNIWFHPDGHLARSVVSNDFSKAAPGIRAHFVHELTHVWQHQNGVNMVLEKVLMFFRHGAFGGYAYELIPGKSLESYNIEQQACIVADAYLAVLRQPRQRSGSILEGIRLDTHFLNGGEEDVG